jgi:hypothetical protein
VIALWILGVLALWIGAAILGAAIFFALAGLLGWWAGGSDELEALVEATREDTPDHVPADWAERYLP